MLMRSQDTDVRSGDKAARRTARASLSQATRSTKHPQAQKIHNYFWETGSTRRMWQGIQSLDSLSPLSQISTPQATHNVDDPKHPSHILFSLLLSGKGFQAIGPSTVRTGSQSECTPGHARTLFDGSKVTINLLDLTKKAPQNKLHL